MLQASESRSARSPNLAGGAGGSLEVSPWEGLLIKIDVGVAQMGNQDMQEAAGWGSWDEFMQLLDPGPYKTVFCNGIAHTKLRRRSACSDPECSQLQIVHSPPSKATMWDHDACSTVASRLRSSGRPVVRLVTAL